MEEVVYRYYRFNIFLLSCIGLWPGMNDTLRRFLNIICCILLWLSIIIQMATFATTQYNMNLLIHNLSTIIISTNGAIKYYNCLFQLETIKKIMNKIKNDWETIKNEEELEIIKKQTHIGSVFTKLFAVCIYPSAGFLIMIQFVPQILDILVPLNETRTRCMLVTVEFFIDEKKYFYLILFFVDICILLIGTSFVATETIFIMWNHHVASLFEIVSARLRNILNYNYSSSAVTHNEKDSLYTKKLIVSVVNLQEYANEFFLELKHGFVLSYFFLLFLGVTSIIINLFRLSQSMQLRTDINELLTSVIFVLPALVYMFYINYATQKLLNSFNDVFDTSYCTKWYQAPLFVQKSLLIFRVRFFRMLSVNIFGIYTPSTYGFGQLIRLSLSYFTALVSCQ